MENHSQLKKFFDEKAFAGEAKKLLNSFTTDILEEEEVEIILQYCNSWFTSYFDNTCDETDFISEIKKLEKPEAEDKLYKFIQEQIGLLQSKSKNQTKGPAATNPASASTTSASASSSAQQNNNKNVKVQPSTQQS